MRSNHSTQKFKGKDARPSAQNEEKTLNFSITL